MAKVTAAGILFVCDGRALLCKRTGQPHAGTWAFPGGGVEKGETPQGAARRETREECGFSYTGPLKPLWTTEDGFQCFGATIKKRFEPKLNSEHSDAQWVPFDDLPKPLHPSIPEGLDKMPSVSEKQHRAMEAAAHGNSTLGIPKKVGKEFVAADGKDAARANDHFLQAVDALHGIARDCMGVTTDKGRK